MKLLLVSAKSDTALGGIAVWTEHYLTHCQEYDIDCLLVNTEVSARHCPNTVHRLWNECARTLRIIRRLKKAVNQGGYDFAHLNTSCGPMGLYRDYFLARYLKSHNIPFALHYHCDIPFWIKNNRRRRWLTKMAQTAYLNMVLCENSRSFLQSMGIESVKVPNFLKDNVVTENEKEISEKLERIFFAGRISINKGMKEIYQLAKRFSDKTFVLAGSIFSPIDTWKKPDNVIQLGPVDHDKVLEVLDDSDLFLFPSHSEGFSMALMEAMARGVPCVAFDSVGANSDMLADGCGVTVPFGDVEAMEQAIRDLEDPAKRKEISEKAIEKVRNNYTTDAVLTLFKSLYESKL